MSNLNTTTAEADARYVRQIVDPVDQSHRIIREWPYIHAQSADNLVVALKAVASYTNPKVDNETYTGKFANSRVTPEQMGDRAIRIIQDLTEITDITAFGDLSNPLIQQNNLIWYPLRSETGEADRIVIQYRNINPASRLVCMETITDPQLKGIADGLVTGTPWVYVTRDFKVMDDNTATFFFICKDYTSDATADDDTDEIITRLVKSVAGHRALDVRVKQKVPAAIADAVMAAGTGWAIPATFDLLSLDRGNADQDGNANIRQTSTKPTTTTFNPDADEIFVVKFWGTDRSKWRKNRGQYYRTFTRHIEVLMTNSEAHAELWANTQDVSGEAWTDVAYMAAGNNPTGEERGSFEFAYLEQRAFGDYRWIVTRCSKDEVMVPKPMAEDSS